MPLPKGARTRPVALAVALAALVLLAFGYGVAVGRYRVFPFTTLQGLWRARPAPLKRGPAPSYGRFGLARKSPADPLEAQERGRLTALGYAGGYERATDAGEPGVTTGATRAGLTLYCSGHRPIVYLLGPDGQVVHQWQVPLAKVWQAPLPFETQRDSGHYIRRAHALPNGDLIGVFEYIGMFKVDRDSQVLWKNLGRHHHDFQVRPDGTIVALARSQRTEAELRVQYPNARFTPSGAVDDDNVVFLGPDGVERKRISVLDAVYRSDHANALPPSVKQRAPDMFHTNSVYVVDGTEASPLFEAGQVLISMRNLSSVMVIDPRTERAVWMLSGSFRWQHQASLLANGHILLLDNLGGNPTAPLQRDQSQVLEIDPVTQQVVWRYRGNPSAPFFTSYLGYVQRLDTGNTLITEATQGRIFEVNPRGDIVWQYRNPHRAGKDDELIATAMGGKRYRRDELPFLD